MINNEYKKIEENDNKQCEIIVNNLKNICCLFVIIIFIINFILYLNYK